MLHFFTDNAARLDTRGLAALIDAMDFAPDFSRD
jgi:hypothetical protein